MRLLLATFLGVAPLAFLASCGERCACLEAAGDPALSLGDGGPWPVSLELASSDEWTVRFDQVLVGATANSTLVLKNVGMWALNVLNVPPPTDPEFSMTLPVGVVVQPGSEINVPISFRPFNSGPKIATVVIQTDSNTARTITLTLTGVGVN
jgi:hypothetical protein